ncbi:MAG: triacylglycerol lipase [Myxococcota bacterium]
MRRAAVFAVLLLAVGCSSSSQQARPAPVAEPYPVVLAHGLSGFRTLAGIEYFYRVPEYLREHGHRVYITHVPPWGTVEMRARVLGQQLDAIVRRSGAPRVHLIAHSMGGLDSRYAISRLGYGDRVASLTTVGTPHRGSVLADGYSRYRFPLWDPVNDLHADFWIWTLGGIKIHSDTAGAVRDLAAMTSAQFNREVPDDARVRYYSFAGRTLGLRGEGVCDDGVLPNPEQVDLAPPELLATALVLAGPDPAHPVANDGLVTVESAKWGVFMGCVPADHLKQIGHLFRVEPLPGRWSHKDFYLGWANELVSGRARTLTAPRRVDGGRPEPLARAQ